MAVEVEIELLRVAYLSINNSAYKTKKKWLVLVKEDAAKFIGGAHHKTWQNIATPVCLTTINRKKSCMMSLLNYNKGNTWKVSLLK